MWKKFINSLNNPGIPFPNAKDGESNKPSTTLLFAYGSFLLAGGSVIYLVTQDPLEGTLCAIGMAMMYNVLYRIRHLDKVTISKDKFEVDGADEVKPSE